jgi:hypothetical protein
MNIKKISAWLNQVTEIGQKEYHLGLIGELANSEYQIAKYISDNEALSLTLANSQVELLELTNHCTALAIQVQQYQEIEEDLINDNAALIKKLDESMKSYQRLLKMTILLIGSMLITAAVYIFTNQI